MSDLIGKLHECCSFCKRNKTDVALLISKPKVRVCNTCVEELLVKCTDSSQYRESRLHELCTFCSFMAKNRFLQLGENPNEVVRNVGGPEVWICQSCLTLCDEIVTEKLQR